MTTKKQAQAYSKRRHDEWQHKIDERNAKRARDRARALWILGALLVVVVAALVLWSLWPKDDADPAPIVTESAGPSSSPAPSADTDPSPSASPSLDDLVEDEGWANSATPPPADLAENRAWTVTLDTNQGPMTFELDGAAAPQATASFISLANEGFFDDTQCHRLVTSGIYVLQCGDPTGTGMGGPVYRFGPLENVPADNVYTQATVAMARVGGDADSMGSQFFILYQDSTVPADAVGGYTVFGKVTDGLDIVEGVADAGTITGEPDGKPAQSLIFSEVSAS